MTEALVIVPTYNEIENISRLVERILAAHERVEVLVVDDNSTDGTGSRADAMSDSQPRLHVLHRTGKLGLGSAYRSGFDYALRAGYDRVFTMDADFSHPPESIPAMLQKADAYDLVIGSRYVPGGAVIDSPKGRRLISYGANLLATRLLGLRARDCTAGFRCYRRQLLERVGYHNVKSNGYSFLIEMLFQCQRAGYTVAEVPITFRDRALGRSKISQAEIRLALLTVLRLAALRLAPSLRQGVRARH
jgi:dolichol-phosphate mannosyltransferase